MSHENKESDTNKNNEPNQIDDNNVDDVQGELDTQNEEAHDDHENNTPKDLIENPDEDNETGETTKGTEEVPTKEGNNNNNEDDEDVQVQGDSYSEYSDIHQRSTAEAINTASAKRGNADISSGTIHETIKT